jgi:branched-chain amino acid transport system permease protein
VLVQFLIGGLVVGCIYALVAIGFTVIYNATETVNFAGGESLMLGAYFILTFSKLWGMPYPLALAATVGAAVLLGFVVFDRLVSKPMMKASLLSRVIALMGLAAIIKGTVRLVWGADAYDLPATFGTRPWHVGPILITPQEVAIVTITLAIIAGLYAFFELTRFGAAMRATAQNRRGAGLVGVNVAVVFAAAWIIGTVLSVLGGVLLGPLLLVEPDMGYIGIKSFTAIVLGGFGSIPGAIVGGILLGVVENLVAGYLRADLQTAATFVLLIGVLAIRPSGLLGTPVATRV